MGRCAGFFLLVWPSVGRQEHVDQRSHIGNVYRVAAIDIGSRRRSRTRQQDVNEGGHIGNVYMAIAVNIAQDKVGSADNRVVVNQFTDVLTQGKDVDRASGYRQCVISSLGHLVGKVTSTL